MAEAKQLDNKDRDHCGISDGLATLCCFLQRPAAPMLGNTAPVKYRQSFIDGDPYQPTAEGALAIKCRGTIRCREQTIVHSDIGSVGIAKYAVCDRMEQAAISRRPDIRRPAVGRRNPRGGNWFVGVRIQVQFGPHLHCYFLSSALCVYFI